MDDHIRLLHKVNCAKQRQLQEKRDRVERAEETAASLIEVNQDLSIALQEKKLGYKETKEKVDGARALIERLSDIKNVLNRLSPYLDGDRSLYSHQHL